MYTRFSLNDVGGFRQITDEDDGEETGDAGTGEVESPGSGVMSTTAASALAKEQINMDGQVKIKGPK